MRRLLLIAGPALLAGCGAQPVKPPPAAEAPPPVTPPPVVSAVAQDWRDWPLTPGTWRYRRDARGSVALFGVPGGDAALTLRCDLAARAMYLSRAGTVTAPLTIRTTSTVRALAVQPTGGTPAYVAVALPVTDPVLEAMGFSRGRFVVEQTSLPPLVIPAWAEIERVTEDCRG